MNAQHQQQDPPNGLIRNTWAPGNNGIVDSLENEIIPHYGISEREMTVEQCTEENNFPIGRGESSQCFYDLETSLSGQVRNENENINIDTRSRDVLKKGNILLLCAIIMIMILNE